ncbi:MAG: type I-MYXAN CRISPR-associated protein Cmx8 [Cyanobacteria bacterium J06621_8]
MTVTQKQNLVTLNYSLSQLSSSQHRAGLAGLVLIIQWLQKQSDFQSLADAELKVSDLDADRVTVQFNLAGFTTLMKAHFSAAFEERERSKKRANSKQKFKTIKRKIHNPDTGKSKETTFYIYTDIVPQGDLVRSFEPANSKNFVWTRLWQEVTWAVLRPRDKQRLPFKAIAEGKEPSEIEKIWNLLQDKPDSKVPLSSTYMLGAQAKSNEGMSFTDLAKERFLLNFWSYVARIYLPIVIDLKGKVKFNGYAIAIPDVRHLTSFCQHFPAILQQRNTEELWDKPRSAIVRNLEETGLDSLGQIQTYLSQLKSELDIDKLLFGVDVFHIVRPQDKPQNKPQMLSIQRYLPYSNAIAEFTQLQNKLYDPLFRQQYWKNLIRDRPRTEGFYALLRDSPTAKTLKNYSFCRDFRTVFSPQSNPMDQQETDAVPLKKAKKSNNAKNSESTKNQEISIESLLLRLLKTYTRHQLERRSGLKWNENWNNLKTEELRKIAAYQNYKKKRQQIVIDLHHDLCRPREVHEFLAYFAAKFTDVYQYITTEEYLLLAQLIQTKPEQIRILCLLALPVL